MCNVSNVSRQASSGSAGQASAATLSILGEGIVGIVTRAPLWLLDRRNRGQMRAGSNRLHDGPLLLINRRVKLTKNGGPCGGARRGRFMSRLFAQRAMHCRDRDRPLALDAASRCLLDAASRCLRRNAVALTRRLSEARAPKALRAVPHLTEPAPSVCPTTCWEQKLRMGRASSSPQVVIMSAARAVALTVLLVFWACRDASTPTQPAPRNVATGVIPGQYIVV